MKKIFWAALLAILVIPSFFSLLRPGFFPMQDNMQVFRLDQMDKCFRDKQIPCRWIPDGGYQYGYPQFNFYAPFVYYLGEIFHLVGFQFIDSIKILIVLGFLFGAIAMYVLAREFFGKWPALVASILYTYAPYKAQEVYVRGSISEFWASVFFPLILWALYKLIKTGKNKYFIWSSLSIAGLFLTHNILSFLFIPIIAFWVLYWLIVQKNPNKWKKTAFAILLGLGISSFFVLPMISERRFVHVETLLGGYFDYRQHFVTLRELFLSNQWGYGSSVLGPKDDLSLSAGIIHWILGAIAMVFALLGISKDRKNSILLIGFGIIGISTLFLMHERSSFVWTIISPLKWLQFPWRFLSISTFVLSFISAFAIKSFGKLKYVLGSLTIILVFVLHANFFTPKTWFSFSDKEALTGAMWERQLTASIFDYLPIYAEFPPEEKAPEFPEVLDGSASFINYKKGSNFQEGDIKVSENATIRIPLYDFPGMEVKIDGEKVDHWNNDCRQEKFCLGLITFKVPKGEHKVAVKLTNTPVRSVGNSLTLASLVFLSYLFLRRKNEKRIN